MGNSSPSVTMEIFGGCQSLAIMDFPIAPPVKWELNVWCTENQGSLPARYHNRKGELVER